MTTSWAARSLPVSYYPPFRLHGTPIICGRGGRAFLVLQRNSTDQLSRGKLEGWAPSSEGKYRMGESKFTKTKIYRSQIFRCKPNVWTLVVNIFCGHIANQSQCATAGSTMTMFQTQYWQDRFSASLKRWIGETDHPMLHPIISSIYMASFMSIHVL